MLNFNETRNVAQRALTFAALASLVLATAPSFAQITVTRSSSHIFYVDTAADSLTSEYAAFQIGNTGDSTYSDVRVRVATAGEIALAANEDGIFRLGQLGPGQVTTAFFYLAAGAEATSPQDIDIAVFDGEPSNGTALVRSTFSMTGVEQTVAEPSNTVNIVTVPVNAPSIGEEFTVAVVGETGVIGPDGVVVLNPATKADWPADALTLKRSKITFGRGVEDVIYDQLVYSAPAGSNLTFTAEYTFMASSATANPTLLSPTSYVAGTGMITHTPTETFGSFPAIQIPQSPIVPAGDTAVASTDATETNTVERSE